MALEEVKFLQKQRERKAGIPAVPVSIQTQVPVSTKKIATATSSATASKDGDGGADSEKDDLALIKDTFAQETAVMVEDPNMYHPYLLSFLFLILLKLWATIIALCVIK